MLIGGSSNKPSLEMIRRIKIALRQVLDLPDEAMITVAQLACLEEECAPLETVIGLHRPGAPQLQHKIHKPTNDLSAEDLSEVCRAWGFRVGAAPIEGIF